MIRPAFSASQLRLAGIALLVLYVLAGAVYSCLTPATARYQDETEYLALAEHLVHGPGFSLDGTHLTSMRPPGYPFFLAPILAVGGGIVTIRIIHYFLVAATILLAARLSAPDRWPVLATVGLVVLYPVLFYTAGTLYAQTLAGFLLVAALAQLLTVRLRPLLALTGGATFGALILAVPTFALTFLVVLAAAWALKLLGARGVMAAALGATLVVGTWTARNFAVFHQFVPVASNSGSNFLLGNNGNTVPYGGVDNIDLGPYLREAQARHLDEASADRYFRDAALHWISHHPGRAARLYLEKTLNFFNVWNEYAPANGAEISPAKQIVMALSYFLLLGLLGWRLAGAGRFPLDAREKFLLILYLASAFTSAIFVTRIRYRLPYDYLLIAVIAGYLARRWQLLGSDASARDKLATKSTSAG